MMAGTEATILTSAIVVGAVWGYRKLVEPHASAPATGSLRALAGVEVAPAPTAQFIPAFAFTYLSLSVIGVGLPDLAKGIAILLATADLLANGLVVFNDISKQAGGPIAGAPPGSIAAQPTHPNHPLPGVLADIAGRPTNITHSPPVPGLR